ncbi:6500_t:CDS:1 [Acaulospora colombiana]|uniref:6500_t:CDS:1 n=1 Tax=Acaulospora colombiana TaxID=27376 RepID=A0ACA9MXR8_9GLOM|nr:6500_t:CDS:1 [Acaulospora colombiana]
MSDNSNATPTNAGDSNKNPFRRPKFPPDINPAKIAEDRIRKLKDPKKINSRGPNCFMIYRAYCTSINIESRRRGGRKRNRNKIQMTELSKMISDSWRNEPLKVKEHYKELADQTELELVRQRRSKEIHILACKRFPQNEHQGPYESPSETGDTKNHDEDPDKNSLNPFVEPIGALFDPLYIDFESQYNSEIHEFSGYSPQINNINLVYPPYAYFPGYYLLSHGEVFFN